MDERQQVEASLRAYLEALERGEDTTARFAGPFREWLELARLDPRASADWKRELWVGKLEATSVGADHAVADLFAELRLVAKTPVGKQRATVALSGPVVLERAADGWKVVDYTRSGRRLVEQLFLRASGGGEAGGLRFAVRGARLDGTQNFAVLDVENSTGTELTLTRAAVARTRRGLRRYRLAVPLGDRRIATGASRVVLWWHAKVPLAARELRVVLEIERLGQRHAVTIPVSLAGGEVEPASVGRTPLRVRRARWLHAGLAWLLACVAGVALLASSGELWFASLLAFALAAALLLPFVRLVRARGRRAALAFAPGLVVALGFLAFGGYGTARHLAGCGGNPQREANAFVLDLLRSGRNAASRHLSSGDALLRGELGGMPRVASPDRQRVIVGTRTRIDCFGGLPAPFPTGGGGPSACFEYRLVGARTAAGAKSLEVDVGCENGRWRVDGLGS